VAGCGGQPGLSQRGLDQRRVQPQGEIRDLPGGPRGRIPGPRAALADLRRHYLLDQIGLPVGRGLDRAQVPSLHSVLAERRHRTGDHERLRAVLPADPVDQAVVLEFGQLLIIDSCRLEQLTPGHVGRRPSRAAIQTSGTRRGPGTVGQTFPDHLQRKVGVPLHGEDVAQPIDVPGREPAVTRP
jgi:hypothetical protein